MKHILFILFSAFLIQNASAQCSGCNGPISVNNFCSRFQGNLVCYDVETEDCGGYTYIRRVNITYISDPNSSIGWSFINVVFNELSAGGGGGVFFMGNCWSMLVNGATSTYTEAGTGIRSQISWVPCGTKCCEMNNPATDLTFGKPCAPGCYVVCSDLKSAKTVSKIKEVSVFPNPIKDKINFSDISEIRQITIYNGIGQQVEAFTPNSSEYDMSKKDQGNYYLDFLMNDGSHQYKKLLK